MTPTAPPSPCWTDMLIPDSKFVSNSLLSALGVVTEASETFVFSFSFFLFPLVAGSPNATHRSAIPSSVPSRAIDQVSSSASVQLPTIVDIVDIMAIVAALGGNRLVLRGHVKRRQSFDLAISSKQSQPMASIFLSF